MKHVVLEGDLLQSASEVFEKKCRLYRAPSDEAVSENIKVAVVHKNLQDAELQTHSLRSAATLNSFTSVKDGVINYSLADALARESTSMDAHQENLVKGKGKKGKGKDGNGKKGEGKGKEKTEKSKGPG